MSYPHLLDRQWCGGPYNGGNCPSCGMVESGNGSVYNQDPYSYHDTTDLFHQLPHYETQQFYCCEYCGGPHFSSDCQIGDPFPCNNYDYSFQDPLPQYQMIQETPQDTEQDLLLGALELLKNLRSS